MEIPADFEADLAEARRLESQRQREPRTTLPLIQVYERLIARLQANEHPFFYATIQTSLGEAYRALQTGNRANNLTRAIACYQEALRFQSPETAPLDYARTQHDLGVAYSELLTGNRVVNLERAMAYYQEALRYRTPEAAPLDYARTQHNLGVTYRELPTGNRQINLERAIVCYQEALRFLTPEAAPLGYASVQHNLGVAYSELLTGNRQTNLERAIFCYQEALRFRTPETAPLYYAATQNNLGTVYWELPTGDRLANLEQAIACYQEALRFRAPEGAPFDYAATQNNLGAAYWELPTGDRATNLERAIACYQETLRFWTPETAPLEHALVQHNLGIAYHERSVGDRQANLERAIACYQEALRFWTPETAPFEYALAQHSLGTAYRQLSTGDRATNLERAIACYQEALRFWTPETAPFEYTGTQNNLGNVYCELPTGNRQANVKRAIACYQEALHFRTVETAPIECRRTNHNLADLYLIQEDWKSALDAYRAAMDAGELLYQAGLSTESKATEVIENALLHRHAAFSAVRCGERTQALILLERGKTRLLTEALRLRVPRPADVPDEAWSAFERAGVAIRAAQSGRISTQSEERDPARIYAARVQAARTAEAALKASIEQVRAYNPEFLQEINLATTLALLPDERTALVDFCITAQGSMGFVVDHRHKQDIQVVEAPKFTRTDLHHLISDWLGAYTHYQREHTPTALTAWQETITDTLAGLSQRLLTPILSTLSPVIEKIIFLPSTELFLLPLHAAPLLDNGSALVCDHYQVSYAPSIEVLANVQAKILRRATPEMPGLYAVINPTADLVFPLLEEAAITRLFKQYSVDEGLTGTKQHLIEGAQGRTYVHFACRGSYDWNDPPESGLALADGRLTLAELQRGEVDLSSARLVTLSACETGIVDVTKGSAEEYVGLPAGFLLAGVPCVVSSLWEVPDLSTALLMERFYRNHLEGGMDFVASLREAQVWIRQLSIGEVAYYADSIYRQSRQEEKPDLFRLMRYYHYQAQHNPTFHPFEHPFYWAAFTVNGM